LILRSDEQSIPYPYIWDNPKTDTLQTLDGRGGSYGIGVLILRGFQWKWVIDFCLPYVIGTNPFTDEVASVFKDGKNDPKKRNNGKYYCDNCVHLFPFLLDL